MAKLRGWRRIASAIWHSPDDPQIYGMFEIDATAALAFMDRARAGGEKITATHLVGRALARALGAMPEVNGRLRRGALHPRKSVDVFFIASVAAGNDLSGVKVQRTNEKSAMAVAAELHERADRLRSGKDPVFTRTKRLMNMLPFSMLRISLRLIAWVTGNLGIGVPALALEANPFGSAMVSSVGMFGLPTGFVPIAWTYHVPIIVLAGEITQKPVAIDGKVRIRPMLPICATIDHRYVDGWHISKLLRSFREYLDDPARFEPLIIAANHGRLSVAR